jgi:hypothetical protein
MIAPVGRRYRVTVKRKQALQAATAFAGKGAVLLPSLKLTRYCIFIFSTAFARCAPPQEFVEELFACFR